MNSELEQLTYARDALAKARTLDEVKAVLDVAVAAKRYAEAKKLGEESVRYAQEIVNRATRRMGEMLTGMPKQTGGDATRTRIARFHAGAELGESLGPSRRFIGCDVDAAAVSTSRDRTA